jgi:corrinoid protein of di/trimethylamine methyltransferase
MSIEKLCRAVENGVQDEAEQIAKDLLNQTFDAKETIDRLLATMQKVGDRFARLEIFLPEMMQAGQAMAAAMRILGPTLSQSAAAAQVAKKGKVVLGTVKGDLHEIGKNIVKLMLETTGFEVKDLGYDVDPLNFIKEAETTGADFIAASALMTTTMPHQKEIIDLLKDRGLRSKYKVVIGGAPTTQEWADKIGADLYCYDAGSAPKLMAKLLGKK